jgi:hypothetical protein
MSDMLQTDNPNTCQAVTLSDAALCVLSFIFSVTTRDALLFVKAPRRTNLEGPSKRSCFVFAANLELEACCVSSLDSSYNHEKDPGLLRSRGVQATRSFPLNRFLRSFVRCCTRTSLL